MSLRSLHFLSSLLTAQNGLAKLVETVLTQVLDARALEQVGAQRYERPDEPMAYRNRKFSTEIFARNQRFEQALVL